MAETAVCFVLDQVLQLLKEEVNLLGGVNKDIADIKDELESIQAFLKDADRRATTEGEIRDGINTWVKQLREAAFRIEDVIDEYMICGAQRPIHSGYAASIFYKTAHLIKTLLHRHRIATEVQDIKSSVREIKKRSEGYNFLPCLEQGSSSFGGNQNGKWYDPRMVSLFIEEAEVVGFEAPRDELIRWLVEGTTDRVVISVVGMGGLGKSTLAKKVIDNEKVRVHFDCHAFVTVSQSYTVGGLLRDMIKQFCKERREPLPQGIQEARDDKSLIAEVRHYLQQKRYVVFFDDVWKVDFWDEVDLATLNNNKGSRVVITTRIWSVAEFCKKSSIVKVHKLQPLPPNKAWELFCKKTFQVDFNGHCPLELHDVSKEIIQKCEGLPLAIVAIGGLLSTKAKTMFEWKKLRQNLRLELERNPHLTSLTRILALSYDDLPYYLKSCLLYFGIYPEDHSISCVRLCREWIAEGFVKHEEGRTLEDVAEDYLTELIHRSLVHVSLEDFDGKARSCRVHDLLREVIIRKIKDSCFCQFVQEDDQLISDGLTRRLAIATNPNDMPRSVGHSHIRAMYIFEESKLTDSFICRISSEFKLLKVLDFEGASLDYVPKNLGNLFHLRYLSLRNTNVKGVPKSIGKLQNLETLDLKQTLVHEIPSEINNLTKLRHLIVYHRNYNTEYTLDWETGVQMKEGIGSLTSLQKLYHVKAEYGGTDQIKEMTRLRQLRKLGLSHVRGEHGKTLCALIQVLALLESLDITAKADDEIIDLHHISSPPQLRRLHLKCKLERLPDWILKLQHLVRLNLAFSKLKDDPLKSLKHLQNLLLLSIWDDFYDGETLHFQEGGFLKLKRLYIIRFSRLNSILIDKGALPVLELFDMRRIPQLKKVPYGILYLKSLQSLYFTAMPEELNQSIEPKKGQDNWITKHVPVVYVSRKVGPRYYDYETSTIRHSRQI